MALLRSAAMAGSAAAALMSSMVRPRRYTAVMNMASNGGRSAVLGRWLLAWLAATVVSHVLASIAHTTMVLNDLRALGIAIGPLEHGRTVGG